MLFCSLYSSVLSAAEANHPPRADDERAQNELERRSSFKNLQMLRAQADADFNGAIDGRMNDDGEFEPNVDMRDVRQPGDATRKIPEAEKNIWEKEALQRRDSFIALEKERAGYPRTGRFVDGKFRPNTYMRDVKEPGDASIIKELNALRSDPTEFLKKAEEMETQFLQSFVRDEINIDQLTHKMRVLNRQSDNFYGNNYRNLIGENLIEKMKSPFINAKETAQNILNLSQEERNNLLYRDLPENKNIVKRIFVEKDPMDIQIPIYHEIQNLLQSFVSGGGRPLTYNEILDYADSHEKYILHSLDENDNDINLILEIFVHCLFSWEKSTVQEQKKFADTMLNFMESSALLEEFKKVDRDERANWLKEHNLLHIA
ncbi:MAG: hypothetical protein CNLJKLNK_01260 [Holosporales bacterium]